MADNMNNFTTTSQERSQRNPSGPTTPRVSVTSPANEEFDIFDPERDAEDDEPLSTVYPDQTRSEATFFAHESPETDTAEPERPISPVDENVDIPPTNRPVSPIEDNDPHETGSLTSQSHFSESSSDSDEASDVSMAEDAGQQVVSPPADTHDPNTGWMPGIVSNADARTRDPKRPRLPSVVSDEDVRYRASYDPISGIWVGNSSKYALQRQAEREEFIAANSDMWKPRKQETEKKGRVPSPLVMTSITRIGNAVKIVSPTLGEFIIDDVKVAEEMDERQGTGSTSPVERYMKASPEVQRKIADAFDKRVKERGVEAAQSNEDVSGETEAEIETKTHGLSVPELARPATPGPGDRAPSAGEESAELKANVDPPLPESQFAAERGEFTSRPPTPLDLDITDTMDSSRMRLISTLLEERRPDPNMPTNFLWKYMEIQHHELKRKRTQVAQERQDYEYIRGHYDRLGDTYDNVVKDYKSADEERSWLREEVARITDNHEALDADYNKLEGYCLRLTDQCKNRREQLEDAEMTINDLKTQLAQAQQNIPQEPETPSRSTDSSDIASAEANAALDDYERHATALKRNLDIAKQMLDLSERKYEELKRVNAESAAENAELEDQVVRLEDNNADLMKQILKLEEENAELTAKHTPVREENSGSQSDNEPLQRQVADSASTIKALKKDLHFARKHVEELTEAQAFNLGLIGIVDKRWWIPEFRMEYTIEITDEVNRYYGRNEIEHEKLDGQLVLNWLDWGYSMSQIFDEIRNLGHDITKERERDIMYCLLTSGKILNHWDIFSAYVFADTPMPREEFIERLFQANQVLLKLKSDIPTVEELRDLLQQSRSESQELRDSGAKDAEERQRLQEALDKKDAVIQDREDIIERLRDTIEEFDQLQENPDSLLGELIKLRCDLQDREEDDQNLREINEELNQYNQDLVNENTNLEARMSDLEQEIAKAPESDDELHARLHEIEGDNRKLNAAITELDEFFDDSYAGFSRLKTSAVAKLKASERDLAVFVGAHGPESTPPKDSVFGTPLKGDYSSLTAKVRRGIVQLQEEIDDSKKPKTDSELEIQVRSLKVDIERLHRKNDFQPSLPSPKCQNCVRLQGEKRRLQERLDRSRQECHKEKTDLQARANQAIQDIKKDSKKKYAEYEARIASLSGSKSSRGSEGSAESGNAGSTRSCNSCGTLWQQNNRLSYENEQLKGDLSFEKKRLIVASDEAQKAKKEVVELKAATKQSPGLHGSSVGTELDAFLDSGFEALAKLQIARELSRASDADASKAGEGSSDSISLEAARMNAYTSALEKLGKYDEAGETEKVEEMIQQIMDLVLGDDNGKVYQTEATSPARGESSLTKDDLTKFKSEISTTIANEDARLNAARASIYQHAAALSSIAKQSTVDAWKPKWSIALVPGADSKEEQGNLFTQLDTDGNVEALREEVDRLRQKAAEYEALWDEFEREYSETDCIDPAWSDTAKKEIIIAQIRIRAFKRDIGELKTDKAILESRLNRMTKHTDKQREILQADLMKAQNDLTVERHSYFVSLQRLQGTGQKQPNGEQGSSQESSEFEQIDLNSPPKQQNSAQTTRSVTDQETQTTGGVPSRDAEDPCKDIKDQLDVAKRQMQKMDDEIRHLRAQLDKCRSHGKAIRQECDAAKAQLALAQEAEKGLRGHLDDAADEPPADSGRKNSMWSASERAEEQSKVKTLEKKQKRVEAELNSAIKRLHISEQRQREAEARCEALEKQVSDVQPESEVKINNLRRDIQAWKERCDQYGQEKQEWLALKQSAAIELRDNINKYVLAKGELEQVKTKNNIFDPDFDETLATMVTDRIIDDLNDINQARMELRLQNGNLRELEAIKNEYYEKNQIMQKRLRELSVERNNAVEALIKTTKKLEALEKDNEEGLSSQLKRCGSDLEDARLQIQDLEKQLKDEQTTTFRGTQEIADLKSQVDELDKRTESARKNNDTLRGKLARVTLEADTLRREKKERESQYPPPTSHALSQEDFDGQRMVLEAQRDRERKARENAVKLNHELQEELDGATASAEQTDKKMQQLQDELESAIASVERRDMKMQELQNELDNKVASVDESDVKIKELEQQLHDRANSPSRAAAKPIDTESRSVQTDFDAQSSATEIEGLTKEITSLQDQRLKAQKRQDIADSMIKKLTARVQNLDKQLQDTQKELLEAGTSKDAPAIDSEDEAEFDKMDKAEAIAALKEKHEALMVVIEDKSELAEELNAITDQHNNVVADLNSAIKKGKHLEDERDTLRREVENLRHMSPRKPASTESSSITSPGSFANTSPEASSRTSSATTYPDSPAAGHDKARSVRFRPEVEKRPPPIFAPVQGMTVAEAYEVDTPRTTQTPRTSGLAVKAIIAPSIRAASKPKARSPFTPAHRPVSVPAPPHPEVHAMTTEGRLRAETRRKKDPSRQRGLDDQRARLAAITRAHGDNDDYRQDQFALVFTERLPGADFLTKGTDATREGEARTEGEGEMIEEP